jgi:hypothetical protein
VHLSSTWFLLLGILLLDASGNGGIKMTIRYENSGRSSRHTVYLQRDRKRMEFRNYLGGKEGPRLVAITRCDLGLRFELNLDAREYTAATYPPKPFTQEEMAARGLPTTLEYVSDKPTLRIEVTTVDTGQRKAMFGCIARHIVTTRKQTPLAGSRSQPQESVTDGWYVDSMPVDSEGIDLNQRLSCDPKWRAGKKGISYIHSGRQPIDRAQFVTIGEPETGFAVHSVTITNSTYMQPDGTRNQSDLKNDVRVTQLEEGPLDPGLFEIPRGFKRVDQIERNPMASSSPVRIEDFWERLKAGAANLFSR